VKFENSDGKIMIYENPQGLIRMITTKGTYTLYPHATIQNLFTGEAKGVKVHFAMKKIVGKLIYWS